MIRILGGTHRGRRLKSPSGRETRPTSALVRRAFFDIIRELKGTQFLDLFSGTGAMALEALSRGASKALAIEASRECCSLIRLNAAALGLAGDLEVLESDVMRVIGLPRGLGENKAFQFIYADPPYEFAEWSTLLASLVSFLDPEGLLGVEHQRHSELPRTPGLDRVRDRRYGATVISLFRPSGVG